MPRDEEQKKECGYGTPPDYRHCLCWETGEACCHCGADLYDREEYQ